MEYGGKSVDSSDFYAKFPSPVILRFQPKIFSLLENPEDLRKWEADLANRVGLKAGVAHQIADEIFANSGTCCESGSPTNDCDID